MATAAAAAATATAAETAAVAASECGSTGGGGGGDAEALLLYCRRLPKAELHAHLHGSIRPATLRELVQASAALATSEEAAAVVRDVLPAPHRSLRDCFRIFDLIHAVVRTPAVVARITAEMVADCASDGVTYLEIRSTPRVLDGTDAGDARSSLAAAYSVVECAAALHAAACMPPTVALNPGVVEYCAAIIRTLADGEYSDSSGDAGAWPACTARLLLSINRTGTVATAADTLAVAAALTRVATVRRPDGHDGYTWAPAATVTEVAPRATGPWVVGVDVSGDPTRGSLATFLPLLAAARTEYGLRCTVHAGEVMNVAETAAVLAFKPDRLGHMCVLAPSAIATITAAAAAVDADATAAAAADAADAAAPRSPLIEICPTSNALTLHLPSIDHHPTMPSWVDAGVPFTLATDDSGVFDVTLSSEYAMVAAALAWDATRIAAVASAGFDAAFAPRAVVAAARARGLPPATA